MLVLSRKADEAIRIGDGILLEVLEISQYRVRLGITAPSEVSIHREEVYQAIKQDVEERPTNEPS